MPEPRIALGDCREVLSLVEPNTFDSCATDAPYEIHLLKNDWDRTGVAYDVETWRAVWRVLKPGALLVAFGYPTTYHRMVCAIEDAGFQIRDLYVWLKGGANMPKGGWVSPAIDKHLKAEREVVGTRMLYGTAALSTNERGGTHSVGVDSRGTKKEVAVTLSATEQAKQWEGWAWNLKPCSEPICFARKPPDGSAVSSLLKWGCGALNVMGCAIPAGPDQVRLPGNIALTTETAQQLSLFSGETRCASNKKPTAQSGRAFHGNGKPQVWAAEALNKGDSGTAERYFAKFVWCRKANHVEKGRAKKGEHGACPVDSVKPNPLMAYLLRLVTPPGGKALDPFVGSGSTIEAGCQEGFEMYGVEKEEAHYEFAVQRCGALPWEVTSA